MSVSASGQRAPGADAEAVARALGSTLTFADVLLARGFQSTEGMQRFLEPRLGDLTPPDGMADLEKASQRIARALKAEEQICVFGDYDCDGITSTAIMTEVLRALGGRVTPRVASRFAGGYGVSTEALAGIRGTGCTLLITCDCGSSDHASLAELRRCGVDVVVIDHHLVPKEPLPALAFLNPHRPDCRFPYKGLASCGLALFLATALRRELGATLDVRQWLDLVAIGTIADVAPLDGDNRVLARAGLERLRAVRRPGLCALLNLAKVDLEAPLSARDVAFRIAPRLNAPGRLGAPDAALDLLIADTRDKAELLAAEVEQRSIERRSVQETMVAEAVALVEAEGLSERAALVVGREGWNHGIAGIVAGRLADKYQRPVVVLGFTGSRGVGSVRGPRGSRLYDALSACAAHVVRFGGHQAAAGVEVTLDGLSTFRACFEEACGDSSASREPNRKGTEDAASTNLDVTSGAEVFGFRAADDPVRLLKDLARLEPCGEANPAPSFAFDVEVLQAREVKGGHLKVDLMFPGGQQASGFGALLGQHAPHLRGRARLHGTLRRDTWRGGGAIEISIQTVLEGSAERG